LYSCFIIISLRPVELTIDFYKITDSAGSYDAGNKILTIVSFNVMKKSRYLNQEWNITKLSFQGDTVNAYNDGPLSDGTQMGPFYEIESVSQAAIIKPANQLTTRI